MYTSSPAEFALQNSSEGGVKGYGKLPLVSMPAAAVPMEGIGIEIRNCVPSFMSELCIGISMTRTASKLNYLTGAAEMQLAEMKFHLHAFHWTLDVDALLTPTYLMLSTVNLQHLEKHGYADF